MYYEKHFIQEWVNRANDEPKEKFLSKFFCYFVAFNYLYNRYGYENRIRLLKKYFQHLRDENPDVFDELYSPFLERDCMPKRNNYQIEGYNKFQTRCDELFLSKVGEREMIKSMINWYCRCNITYKPFDLLAEDAALRTAVRTRNSNDTVDNRRINENYIRNQERIDREEIAELFLSIYIVRCNLFHGAKSMIDNLRNISLVEESNIILADFLSRFTNNY